MGRRRRGPEPAADGTILKEAIEANPEAYLGPEHVAAYGADPGLLVKLLDAGERLPVHYHPGRAFAQEHLGLRYGKTESWLSSRPRRRGRPVGSARRVARDPPAAGSTRRTRRPARRPERAAGQAGDAVFVPAGVLHAIGDGILIPELQEPTDLSVLLEWDGFGIDDGSRDLGLGWEAALASVELTARDASALLGPAGDGAVSELLPAAAARLLHPPSAWHPKGPPWSSRPASPSSSCVEGAGTLAGLEVTRGDALLVPHAAGPVDAHGHLVALVCRPPEVPAA